jgi:hypothetical protein
MLAAPVVGDVDGEMLVHAELEGTSTVGEAELESRLQDLDEVPSSRVSDTFGKRFVVFNYMYIHTYIHTYIYIQYTYIHMYMNIYGGRIVNLPLPVPDENCYYRPSSPLPHTTIINQPLPHYCTENEDARVLDMAEDDDSSNSSNNGPSTERPPER